jgi:two-component system KDP operon response regulator KdpE
VVLVVEDEAAIRDYLAAAVRAWGWEATTAASLAEARTVLGRQPLDLVILDSRLPDGDGVEFIGEIRGGPAGDAPILLYTGLGIEEGRRGLASGADAYLVKPAPQELLHRKAFALLRRPGRSRPAEGGARGGDRSIPVRAT